LTASKERDAADDRQASSFVVLLAATTTTTKGTKDGQLNDGEHPLQTSCLVRHDNKLIRSAGETPFQQSFALLDLQPVAQPRSAQNGEQVQHPESTLVGSLNADVLNDSMRMYLQQTAAVLACAL
jgi:hypothetical protein